jgi:hypothetical protein
MSPKTPFDKDLEEYLDRVRESVHPSRHSVPPTGQQIHDARMKMEQKAEHARKKIRHHLNPEDSGVIYLDKLEEIHAVINKGEVEKRKALEDRLKVISDRFWLFVITVGGIVVAGFIVWIAATIIDAHDKIVHDATTHTKEIDK